MAILRSLKAGDNSRIWCPEKECILFKFENGVFETDDKYIIEFYNKHFSKDGEIQPVYEVETKEVETEVDEKKALEDEIKERFGIDVDRRLSVKKLKAKLAQLEAEA